MKLKLSCPRCGRADIQTTLSLSSTSVVIIFGCGHTLRHDNSTPENLPQAAIAPLTDSPDNSNPPKEGFSSILHEFKTYDYQTDGVKFIENTNYRCLIADATGLGKTIQFLVSLRESGIKPALILVKPSILYQWAEEYRTWVNPHPMKVMPVITKTHLLPGFDAYIMSMDLFGRMKDLTPLLKLGIQIICLDEAHNYKNPGTGRTQNLIKFCEAQDIQHIVALSATPIRNRADEYFTILNLLDPARFNSLDNFKKRWLVQNEKGAWSRINPYRLEEFKELTKKYILRREKCDVLTNLPPLSRNFTLVEIEDENLKKIYNKTLGLFDNFLNDNSGIVKSNDLLGWLAKLRAITGQAKCQNAIDFAQEFLDSTDDQLTIGINHISVRDTLKYIFQGGGYACESLSGEDDSYRKNAILRRFRDQDFRLLILNMRSGGEGLNIQNCADALVLERAWNAAEEEQFEGRFHRDGQQKAVTVNYFIARGTVDFFFHELVNKKRNIVGETLVNGWQLTNDNDSLLELSQLVIKNKL